MFPVDNFTPFCTLKILKDIDILDIFSDVQSYFDDNIFNISHTKIQGTKWSISSIYKLYCEICKVAYRLSIKGYDVHAVCNLPL